MVVEVIDHAFKHSQRVGRVLNRADEINEIRPKRHLRRVALDRFDPWIIRELSSLIFKGRLRQFDRDFFWPW
jgi:hypothetical protein